MENEMDKLLLRLSSQREVRDWGRGAVGVWIGLWSCCHHQHPPSLSTASLTGQGPHPRSGLAWKAMKPHVLSPFPRQENNRQRGKESWKPSLDFSCKPWAPSNTPQLLQTEQI
ncbi:hypothetical protein VULLAG_LOCUS5905 [Vulpes lagopus]